MEFDQLCVNQLQHQLIRKLSQRFVDSHTFPSISYEQQQQLLLLLQQQRQQQRNVLELFHLLFKHHRHLIRHLKTGSSDHSSQEKEIHNHAALITLRELTLLSPFWDLVLPQILRSEETQYAMLRLLIDLEKYRTIHSIKESWYRYVVLCHENISRCTDQLIDVSLFKPSSLRKLFELLGLLVKDAPPATAGPSPDSSHNLSNALELSVYVLKGLAPLLLKIMTALSEHDPELDYFSTEATVFIFSNNPAYTQIHKALQPLVSNPEAIRQLGRVFLTAVLSILSSLTNPKAHSQQATDLTKETVMLDQIASQLPSLSTFLQSWVGPKTLKILLRIYAEDDAGISWLLLTIAQIHQKLDQICSHDDHYYFSSSVIPSPSLLLSVKELYIHLHRHVHPLEALFLFLETIGYDHQTLLDLLLTLDDQRTGGMLSAMMMVLRTFTEHESDQKTLIARWHHQIILEEESKIIYEDDDDNNEQISPTRTQLCNMELCLSQLVDQIRKLNDKNLFPYNPRALLVVLDHSRDILSSVIATIPYPH
ncbi:hypothetical protein BX616_001166 [Lobosporangium transversale]|uniref:Protein Lines C-terminal domain-containing protein n=1 Tax=Lobosporangium transversale TaxID=64571 RepID=A0A1Y2GLS9_9FUNG|nr:hypothetical protein BCR41DRAFT_354907 [Lobosporangium transversale]KAF9904826.1 hypothetical protein BX616_001166 [Lobosporangium transversale]ORZ14458.1 hypothetical protein BCR41DRAFT_354907 [Lobosporangium transversale]|eukprot:XP_021880936.1 hypothetical protein BCR41DRAFT_354907 [Lobosporangium transversale]